MATTSRLHDNDDEKESNQESNQQPESTSMASYDNGNQLEVQSQQDLKEEGGDPSKGSHQTTKDESASQQDPSASPEAADSGITHQDETSIDIEGSDQITKEDIKLLNKQHLKEDKNWREVH